MEHAQLYKNARTPCGFPSARTRVQGAAMRLATKQKPQRLPDKN